MKKLVLLLAVVFSVSLFSCGGSDAEKAVADSVAAAGDSVTQAVDSLNKTVDGAVDSLKGDSVK